MTQEALDQIVREHSKWLKNPSKGKQANLSGEDLSGEDLSGVYLPGANLSGVDLSEANLYNINLSGANLSGAILSETYLSRSNLSDADLSSANLYKADLYKCDLPGSNLSGAYLYGADLFGVDFSNTLFNNTTYGDGLFITKEPVQITSLIYNIIIFDTHMKIGCELHSFEEWDRFLDEEIARMDRNALDFWEKYCKMLFEIIKSTRGYNE